MLDRERERVSWKMSNFLGKIVKDVGSLSDSSNCQWHDNVSTVDASIYTLLVVG
jgi:hypothetical protein